MSHVLPNISRGRFFEPIFTSKKFDLYTSIYGNNIIIIIKTDVLINSPKMVFILNSPVSANFGFHIG